MHEFSLVASVIETVEESARQAGATEVLKVRVVAGELTQVVEEAMRFAFEALRGGTCCEHADLVLELVGARSRCLDCGREFAHDPLHRKCPSCGSAFTEIIAGRELFIDSIEVDIPPPSDS